MPSKLIEASSNGLRNPYDWVRPVGGQNGNIKDQLHLSQTLRVIYKAFYPKKESPLINCESNIKTPLESLNQGLNDFEINIEAQSFAKISDVYPKFISLDGLTIVGITSQINEFEIKNPKGIVYSRNEPDLTPHFAVVMQISNHTIKILDPAGSHYMDYAPEEFESLWHLPQISHPVYFLTRK